MTENDEPRQEAYNPYLAARREWNERYGSYVVQANAWRVAAMASLAIAVLAVGGVVWLGGQNQLVPYVVKVDKLGASIAVDRADRAQRPDRAVITAQLARWIVNVRSVYIDAAAQRVFVTDGYAMINSRGDAFGVMNEHMRAHDPFQRAKTETVTVEVQSVLPLAGDSWRIEWREEIKLREAGSALSQHYQATVTIGFNPPTDEATIRANPMGIYVNSFSWAQRL
jgi:type IV secretory pathway TrbF-like protein